MPESRSTSSGPSLTCIERPPCPICETSMSLARIMPGPAGFDYRNFECAKCDYAETRTVCIDPMSVSAGWLAGEMKPPG